MRRSGLPRKLTEKPSTDAESLRKESSSSKKISEKPLTDSKLTEQLNKETTSSRRLSEKPSAEKPLTDLKSPEIEQLCKDVKNLTEQVETLK